ncbi:MAG: phosphoribosylformylglycinamidine synthase subunit PurL [Armatimonadota bacterium]|nr:phosphoribosylformylglycinamidine synthase subunit PurL [Armatimonadota bacterium]MCX7777830.1 phosphoribosylformylglycinamidine synthase subunit PurL [Armatimonadota bacterium]MDW8025821.1 phosphoribosylformylglycinamidine synthase subunit PurL [Armatimonadota bacterium]
MESMLQKAIALGLSESEYRLIVERIGREPTDTELAMFSVEWSEHCGYLRSRKHLRTLPKAGKYHSMSGSDAGGIEIENGLWVIFKMESHNHPSQIEPKQGAATGIGGIVRDILATGARPIALIDSLRFGDPSSAKARYIFSGVVDGIQWYGNCIGVPTVAGEVYFNDCYRTNCIVGVMCIGIVKQEHMMSSAAKGVGNAVIYVGNPTGRDGIGGCSILASHELREELSMRPTVQLGDPFTEKCLIEACLEAYRSGAVVAVKDMGAAGLTCTTSEMSAAGGVGMRIDLSMVPKREKGMDAWEVMMSESQERMLLIVERGREDEVLSIFRKWGLNAVVIGEVTMDGMVTVYDGEQLCAKVKADDLAEPPEYDLPMEQPKYLEAVRSFDITSIAEPENLNDVAKLLLTSPNIASKRWIYEQYDHTVQTNTVVAPGDADAAVLRIKPEMGIFMVADSEESQPSRKGIAVTADCNSLYCYLDPYLGAQIAVAEAARNLVCVGAEPAGVTDCLCFGNPDRPDRFWQFVNAVRGIADACSFFELPVVSGNVSFYNESEEAVIHPTPLIGMVGVIEDVNKHVTMSFKNEGDVIILLGLCKDELGGSEYLRFVYGIEAGKPPQLDLSLERSVHRTTLEAIRNGLVMSAHDCSEGGLFICIAECCMAGNIGAHITLSRKCIAEGHARMDSLLFGESQSRIVISVPCGLVNHALELAEKHGCPATVIGAVGGECLTIEWRDGDVVRGLINLPVEEMRILYEGAIPALIEAGIAE